MLAQMALSPTQSSSVVGTPSALGQPVPLTDFADHVFGVCLVNDWSARDGSTRSFLADGDEVSITATAPGPPDTSMGLGEVRGRISPALVDAVPRD
jgi:hypothetical protein